MPKRTEQPDADTSWGARCYQARRDLGLSTREVAERAGVDHSTVVRIEGDSIVPRFRTMRSIAEALDASIEELFPMASHPSLRVA